MISFMPLSERKHGDIAEELSACDALAWRLGEALGRRGVPVLMYRRRADTSLMNRGLVRSDPALGISTRHPRGGAATHPPPAAPSPFGRDGPRALGTARARGGRWSKRARARRSSSP